MALFGLLAGCGQTPNYAPVQTVNQALSPMNGDYPADTVKGEGQDNASLLHSFPKYGKTGDIPAAHALPNSGLGAGNSVKPKRGVTIGAETEGQALAGESQPKALPEFPGYRQNDVRTPNKIEQQTNANINPSPVGGEVGSRKSSPSNKEAKLGGDTAHKSKQSVATSQQTAMLPLTSQTTPKTTKHKKIVYILNNSKNVLTLNFGWPFRGRIAKNFYQTDNKGIDIIGKSGQSVRAAESGKAVYCGQGLAGFGNLVVIKHNENYLSAYANNNSLAVREGELVNKGQKIGELGFGKRRALHFEIRKMGKAVNPLKLLPRR